MNRIITVTQCNRYIKSVLEEDTTLNPIFIQAEVSNFTNHYKTGHYYFTLKDEKSSLKAVMFRSFTSNVPFVPENGMQVIVSGNISVYEAGGVYQLYARDILPVGTGSYQIAFDQLKNKLEKQGLFEISHKKQLPEFPRTIGVITAEQGAALQDVLSILERRYPFVKVRVYPAAVQGTNCATSVRGALQLALKDSSLDLILIARGGGSAEDLWGFNDEELALDVFRAKTPIVSAVGHEIDYTILDFVADLRAPTPSAAAEMIVPNIAYKKERLAFLKEDVVHHMQVKLAEAQTQLTALSETPLMQTPFYKIERQGERLRIAKEQLERTIKKKISRKEERLNQRVKVLGAVNVHRQLKRGFALLQKENSLIKSLDQVKIGDNLTAQLGDGKLKLEVKDKETGGFTEWQ